MTMDAKGLNGQISVDDQFVTLYRKGFNARIQVGRGEKRIPLMNITSVQWKDAGAVMEGFIQFSLPGGNEVRSKFGQQSKNARQDENSVTFRKSQQGDFEQIRAFVESRIGRATSSTVQTPDLADQLGKLAALRDQGVLSEEEFATQKAKLLR